jgi:hypothetical protein
MIFRGARRLAKTQPECLSNAGSNMRPPCQLSLKLHLPEQVRSKRDRMGTAMRLGPWWPYMSVVVRVLAV